MRSPPFRITSYNVCYTKLLRSSQSSSSGSASINLTFAAGTDPDIAQVQVQNRLSIAQPRLPQEVIQNVATQCVFARRGRTGAASRSMPSRNNFV